MNNIGPNSNRLEKIEYYEYQPPIRFRNMRFDTPPVEIKTRVIYVDGRPLYDIAKNKTEQYYNQLRNQVHQSKLNYVTTRIRKQQPVIERIQASNYKFRQIIKDINDWKTEMLDNIVNAETERDKLKKQLQYQLNNINKLQKVETDLDDQKQDYESINTHNLQLLEEKIKISKFRIYSYYGILIISIMWMLFILYNTLN